MFYVCTDNYIQITLTSQQDILRVCLHPLCLRCKSEILVLITLCSHFTFVEFCKLCPIICYLLYILTPPACDCNGLSQTCEFDEDLYRQTGHGGRCTNCMDNTDGVNCELCKANFWRRENQCLNCGCDPTGGDNSWTD